VLSVTSETAASGSFQAPQPKPGRPDQAQQTEGFAALVDSSVSAQAGSDGPASYAQQPPAPERRARAPANADHAGGRDASPERSARRSIDDQEPSARAKDAGQGAKDDLAPVQRPRPRSATSEDSTANEKPSADATSATEAEPLPQQEEQAPAASAVAVAISVGLIATDPPSASAPSGGVGAPLAIAAGAIAATTAAEPTAGPPQTNLTPETEASTPPSTPVTASKPVSGPGMADVSTATTKPVTGESAPLQVTVGETAGAPVPQPGKQTDTPAASEAGIAVAAAVSAPPPKTTTSKLAVGSSPVTAGAGTSDSDSAGTDSTASPMPASSAASPQTAAANPKPSDDGVTATPSEVGTNASPAPAAPVHDRSPTAAPTHAPSSMEPGAGALQAPLPTAPANVAPVGPLSVVAATDAPVPLSGLAVEIAASALNGKSRFDIRLDPAHLGRIDVRIDVDRNGQVTSHLTVEKPETLSMLRQDAPQLQRALDDAGFKTGDGGLQFSLRDQSSSRHENGDDNGRNARTLVISDEETIPAVIAGRSYGRVLGSSSGVDIRI
jgi:flagellar hook-length control protein FliK